MFALSDERTVAVVIAAHARRARRLRLEVAALLGNPGIARELEAAACGRPGVVRASANPRSGRLLIEYEPDAAVLAELERYARTEPQVRRPAAAGGAGARWHSMTGDEVAARMAAGARWHSMTGDEVAARLATSGHDGLAADEAVRRLGAVGANVLEDEAPRSRLAVVAGQLANLPTGLLLGSTIISILLGDVVEAAAIVTVIGLNTAIGYHVERRSADLLASWRAAEHGPTEVIRGGSICRVAIETVVPGDVLVVRAGELVPADCRIVDAHRLAADEAALTGESEPATKSTAAAPAGAALAERSSMLYRGTSIASGHGRAIVVATGAATEIASVQRLSAEARAPKGRLQRRLAALTSRLAWSGLAASGVAGLASLAWRKNPLEILRESVALGVAAIPEGLPVSTTTALVRAMAHMRERGIVVRRLATAETLGGVTVACSDKTGTLTENRMRVEVVSLFDGDRVRRIAAGDLASPASPIGPLGALLAVGVLDSDLDYQASGDRLELAGSSTERALVELAARAGLDPIELRRCWPRRQLIDRHEGASYMISEHDGALACIKGAPEQVIPLCELSPALAGAVLDENAALAGQGLRVLALGWHNGDSTWQCLGLVGLRDPLRDGSVEAVELAARAGIRTVILTGDQRRTAEAIARQARLDGDVIEGGELPALLAAPDAAKRLRKLAAIARVAPADKVAVVEALRKAGEVVAMIGDGVNDAPALRAADVGIAVGARSSDLARQTADVVLEHADLRSILAAVAEGRAVQDNLRRSVRFQAAGNLGELLLAVCTALAGHRGLTSLGHLWINLITDTLPGLALALEPTEAGLLDRPPAAPAAPILDDDDWRDIARDGALLAGASGIAAMLGGPLAAFGVIGTTQFGYAAMCRASDVPLQRRFGLLVGGSALLHLLAVAARPLTLPGHAPLALATALLGLAGPLYVAWTRQTITRRSPKEIT
jgi:Ca2+-transporting ATPase